MPGVPPGLEKETDQDMKEEAQHAIQNIKKKPRGPTDKKRASGYTAKGKYQAYLFNIFKNNLSDQSEYLNQLRMSEKCCIDNNRNMKK